MDERSENETKYHVTKYKLLKIYIIKPLGTVHRVTARVSWREYGETMN